MAFETIIVEARDHITFITLNRPDVLNALSAQMQGELHDALDQFDADEEAWVAIISGNGRSFCSGADLRPAPERGSEGAASPARRAGGSFLTPTRNWKPVIAAVHGYVYGMGCGLACECDVIIATEDSRFALPETKRGMSGGNMWSRLFPWMPSKVAVLMALTGDPIPAQDAYRLGLVSQLVGSREELLPAAIQTAERLLAASPLAVRATVRVTRMVPEELTRQVSLASEGRDLRATEDFREAGRSFAEKRAPVWKGR